MPQVIPVVIAAFQTAVTWAATAAASATLALTGSAVASAFVGNAILAAGGMLSASVAAGAPLAAATGLLLRTVAIQQLMKALSPKPKNLNGGAQIRFGPNPQAPRPFLFGRTGTAGTPVVATTHGSGKNNNKWLTYIVALSAFGPVQSIEALALNGVNAPVSGGMVVSGQYANKVWSTYRNGEWTQIWTPTFGPSTIPEWTTNHRGAGIAHACLTYEYDQNVFTGGAPAPVWTVQGSTSIYNASTLSVGYSGNPADVYYTILRGIQSPNGTPLGVGLAAADIDQAKIAAWRAVCVANNWTVGGVWQVTAETPADVLRAVLQAGGAEFAINDGKASVDFFASAASAYTIRENDLAGDPIERPSTDRKARVSRIIPRFRSEADGWDLVPAAPVVDTTLDAQDGNRRRTETMDFPYVSSAQQARQLAAYNLRARRSPVFELPIKPHGVGIPCGARVTLDLGEYGISTSTCVVIKNDATATDGGTLTVRSDPSDLHTWALGQDGSTVSPGSMPRDPASTVQNVDPADWLAVAASITAGGSTLPIIRVSGTFPNPTLARLDVQIKPNASTDWVDTSSLVSGTAFMEIRGLTPSTIYNIRARYITTGGVASPAWVNFPNVTTGSLSTLAVVGPQAANLVPGSGPIYRPDRPSISWMGEPENARWTVVETGNVGLGAARWNYNINPSIASDPLMSPLIAIEGGAVISAQAQLFRLGTWTTGDIGAAIHVYDASLVQLGSPIMIGWATAGTPVAPFTGCFEVKAENITLPGGAAYIRAVYDVVSATGSGSGGANRIKINRGATCAMYSEEATSSWTFGSEIGRDFRLPDGTLAAVEQIDNNFTPRTDGLTAITVQQDFAGNALPGQLDRTFQIKRFRGTTDVTSTTTFSVTMTGGTATITSGGLLQITSTVGGRITVTTVRDGLTIPHIIEVTAINAAPPVTGGGGARTAVDTTIDPTSSGSLVTCGGPITVRAGAAGQISFGASLAYTTSSTSNSTAGARIRYRVGAGAWTWAAAEVTGTAANSGFAYEQGDIDAGTVVTGLVNGTDYECELQCRRATGSGTLYFYGSFAAEAS